MHRPTLPWLCYFFLPAVGSYEAFLKIFPSLRTLEIEKEKNKDREHTNKSWRPRIFKTLLSNFFCFDDHSADRLTF
jgi:hypothetical protein